MACITDQTEPIFVILGKVGTDAEFIIHFEGMAVLEPKSIREGIFFLFSVYYNFDISYPRPILPILLFFQVYVFDIKTELKKLPEGLSKLLNLIIPL